MPTNVEPEAAPEESDEQLARTVAEASAAQRVGEAKAAFEQLYRRHARLLAAYIAARVAAADVDDILQAVWLKAWNRIDSFQGGAFRSWIYEVTRNTVTDWQRMRRLPTTDEADHIRREDEPLQVLLDRERTNILRDCLSALAEREQGTIRLLLAGFAYDEVCRQLQIVPNVAYKLARAAKAKLKTCVERKLT